MHEAGKFKATVVQHGFNMKNGKPRMEVLFATEKNEEIKGYFYLTSGAAEYTMDKIRNMGFQGDDIDELQNDEYALANNECIVVITHDSWEGKTSAKVDNVWSINGPGGKPKNEKIPQLSKLNALLRAKPKVEAPKVEQDMKRTNDENDDYPF